MIKHNLAGVHDKEKSLIPCPGSEKEKDLGPCVLSTPYKPFGSPTS
jgi:hypothetical protein